MQSAFLAIKIVSIDYPSNIYPNMHISEAYRLSLELYKKCVIYISDNRDGIGD